MKSHSKIQFFLLLFFGVFCCFSVFAQQQHAHLKFQRFGVDQGLTVTTAFSIVQDDHGFLWIATIDGLQRYDGYKFTAYKNNFNDSCSVSDNTISYLYKGKGNVIWVGTYAGGLNRLDINTGKFKRYQNISGAKNCISNNRVWSVYEDKIGNIWVGTESGLDKIDIKTNQITSYFHDEKNEKSLCNNDVLSITQDKYGILWIGTAKGLSKAILDEKGNIREFVNFKNCLVDSRSLSGDIVMSLHETKDGSMYIGTNNGLSKFIPADNCFSTMRFSSKIDTMSNQVYSYLNTYGDNAVRAIYEDKDNLLWLATDKGLKILNQKTGEYISHIWEAGNPITLSADLLCGICEDRSGNLWIGTIVGGLNKVNLKSNKFQLCQTQNGNPTKLSKNNIRSFFVDSKKTLWVGTLDGGLNRWNAETQEFEQIKNSLFNPDIIWCINEDKNGTLWIGTSIGLYSYDLITKEFKRYVSSKSNSESISDNTVRSIFEDSKGNLWIGTEGGLNKLDRNSGSFTRYLHDAGNKNSISNNTVWTIRETENTLWVGTDNGLNKLTLDEKHNPIFFKQFFPEKGNKGSISNKSVRSFWIDADGTFWIGTSNGLNKFNITNETFSRFNEESGLANSYIYGVLGDNKDNLWISTNNGISRFNKKTMQFRNFDKLDGLQNNEFNTGAYYRSANGELFFGGPDGFNRFFPDSLGENKVPPPIVITSIKIFGVDIIRDKQPYDITDITLKHDENVISFEFAALDFTLPEKNLYTYKLEGFDKDWVKPGNRRFVNYTNLDPGQYNFKVRACNSDGVWNESGITIHLTIVPPFWKTWWFRISALAFLIVSVTLFFKNRINRLRRVQNFLEEQVYIKTAELREEKELVDEQNKLIEKKNHNITSSIRYAKRIQEAILPIKERLNDLIPEAFIFFKPKDIVSGDFYWFTKRNDKIFLAAVDCTGHGVPGAFMSLIGNNLLNDIVKSQGVTDPAKILSMVHEGLVLALKKGEQESDTVDGMDITLCVLNGNELEFSSTGRPLILIRSGEIKKHKVGKHPLGLVTKKELKFEKESIQLQAKDTFYIFTDGYCDQFGGAEDEKYLDSNFENFLLKIQGQKMPEQLISLDNEMTAWKGQHQQIDDMLVIGVRV